MIVDAADPDSGYVAPACPFPGPHGHLVQTNLDLVSGFMFVCRTHMDAAIATVAAPTPVIGQRQPRCSGCDAGPELTHPFEIAATYPARPVQDARQPHVRSCREHAVLALTALLGAS